MVSELGCPRSGLTALNVRASFKPLYVFLKHFISENKVMKQPWRCFTCQILHLFPRTTPTPKKTKTILIAHDFTIVKTCQHNHHRLNHLHTLYPHQSRSPPETNPENTRTHSLVINFLSFNSRQYQSNYQKQDFLITTSKICHCLLQLQINFILKLLVST